MSQFFDTVGGQRFTSRLITALEEIADHLRVIRTVQYTRLHQETGIVLEGEDLLEGDQALPKREPADFPAGCGKSSINEPNVTDTAISSTMISADESDTGKNIQKAVIEHLEAGGIEVTEVM